MAEPTHRKPRSLPRIEADLVEAPQVTSETTTAPPPPGDPRPPPVGYEAPGSRVSRVDLPPARAPMGSQSTERILKQAVQEAEAARLDAEAKAAKLAVELEQARKRAPSTPAEFDAVAYFTKFQVIALKFFLPLAAVLGAGGLAFGIWNKTAIEPKVDRAVVKQEQQDKKAVTVDDRVLALEKYARAKVKWEHCIDAERDSALERGTGHNVESRHDDVTWVEQSAPKVVPRPIWKIAPWSILKEQGCGAEPSPPSTPDLP